MVLIERNILQNGLTLDNDEVRECGLLLSRIGIYYQSTQYDGKTMLPYKAL